MFLLTSFMDLLVLFYWIYYFLLGFKGLKKIGLKKL